MTVQLIEITRQHFRESLVHAKSQLRLTNLEMAQIFQISLPTVDRWLKGEAAPHPVGREPILQALRRRGAEIEIPCPSELRGQKDRSTAVQIETPLDSTPGKGGPG